MRYSGRGAARFRRAARADASDTPASNICLTVGHRWYRVRHVLCAQRQLRPTQEGNQVGQKTVRFSDLSGEIIPQDDAVARIVVHEHPELGDSPVEIEVLPDEARAIDMAALRVAVVDLYLPGEDEPRRVAMDADSFDKMATDKAMSEILVSARPPRRSSRATGGVSARSDRIDYASVAHAGKPHKGRITDGEKQLVRERFDEVNELLAEQGIRTISLADREHVERYGLEELARSRGIEPD
jgi:hypothetical protein